MNCWPARLGVPHQHAAAGNCLFASSSAFEFSSGDGLDDGVVEICLLWRRNLRYWSCEDVTLWYAGFTRVA